MKKAILAMLCACLLTGGLFAQEKKKRIAILPFKNKGGKEQYSWLSEGFATTMTEALQQVQGIYVVDRQQAYSVIKKNKYTNEQLFTSETAYDIAQQLSLDHVIIGAFDITKGNINAIAIVASGTKRGEYNKKCLINPVKSMKELWLVYDELVNGVTKAECFNVTISESELKQVKAITANTINVSAYEYYIKGRKEHLTYSVKGYEMAIGWYKKAIELDPSYSLAIGATGEAQAFWGYQKELNGEEYKSMYDAALKNAQQALTISPNIGSIHRNMATTYQMLRRFEDAKVEAQKAIDLNQNDAEAWYMLWRSTYGSKPEDASIQRSLEISPYLPVANLTLGNYYLDAKDYVKAEEYYKKSLVGNDDYELAHANLGNLFGTLNRFDEAIYHLGRATELKPRYSYAIGVLAWVYEKQGDQMLSAGDATGAAEKFNLSFTNFQQAVEINPNDSWASNALARVRKKAGK